MTKTTKETLKDRQAEIADIMRTVKAALDELALAESCETPEDFDINLADARVRLKIAKCEIEEVRS